MIPLFLRSTPIDMEKWRWEVITALEAVNSVHHPVDCGINSPNYECHEYGSYHDNHRAVGQIGLGWPRNLMNELVIRFL